MRLLGIVTAAAALGLVSAAYQSYAEMRDRRQFPPPGQLADIDGHRLHMWCAGEGNPPVIIIPALGTTALDWVGVPAKIRCSGLVELIQRRVFYSG